jgi:hypothetical protein
MNAHRRLRWAFMFKAEKRGEQKLLLSVQGCMGQHIQMCQRRSLAAESASFGGLVNRLGTIAMMGNRCGLLSLIEIHADQASSEFADGCQPITIGHADFDAVGAFGVCNLLRLGRR